MKKYSDDAQAPTCLYKNQTFIEYLPSIMGEAGDRVSRLTWSFRAQIYFSPLLSSRFYAKCIKHRRKMAKYLGKYLLISAPPEKAC